MSVPTPRRQRPGPALAPKVEPLEPRCHLSAAASATVSHGRLVVRGTAGADQIDVAQRLAPDATPSRPGAPVTIAVRVNGGPFREFTLPPTARVVVRAGRGDDLVHFAAIPDVLNGLGSEPDPSLRPLPLAARVDLGAGDDRFLGGVGGGPSVVDGGPGGDILSGGSAADVLRGGPGDDSVSGGPDVDRLFGGRGADGFNDGDGVEELLDFGPRDTRYVSPTVLP